MSDAALRFWEFASYLVTVLGLPLALFAIWREMRAERINEAKEIEQREDEIYVELSQQYSAFLESVLANPELDLLGEAPSGRAVSGEAELSPALKQKRQVYYEMLIALFERAFILLHEPSAQGDAARRWQSWADYMDWWLKKPDFRAYALANLDGEDAAFAAFVRGRAGAIGTERGS
jgi:hypothetical protein